MNQTPSRGFTLVELLITLALLAALFAIAVPSYRALLASQQVRSASSDLLSALNLARSEAVKRASNVTLEPVTGSGTGAWNSGWSVKAGGTELRRYSVPAGVVISGAGTALTYSRDGRSGGAAAFTVSPAQTADISPRYVCVSLGGKPKVKQGGCP